MTTEFDEPPKRLYGKAQKRAREKQYRKELDALIKSGLYSPKEKKLTAWRKREINRLAPQIRKFVNDPDYTFAAVPTRNKETREKIITRAKQLNFDTVPKGIWVKKEGQRTARISKNRQGEFQITLSGKIKRGERAGKRITEKLPLADDVAVEHEEERLRKMAKAFGKLKKGERIAFGVRENGVEGWSHMTFQNVDMLINRLREYKKTFPHRVNFYRHITIYKTETAAKWRLDHPRRGTGKQRRNMNKTGRSI